MEFSRRQMMQTVLIGGSLLASGGIRLANAASYKPSLFLLGGIDPSTTASQLFSALDPIVSQNVPVGCIVKFTDDSGIPMAQDSALAVLLRSLVANYAGLIEIISYVPDLVTQSPYFRMRSVSETRRLCNLVLGEGADFLSIASEMPTGGISEVNEVRAAGFRNLLLFPQQPRIAGYWETSGGMLQFYGGNTAEEGDSPIETALDNHDTAKDALIVYVSLAENSTSDEDAFVLGAKIGDRLSIKNAAGDVFSTLPSELHIHSNTPYGRLIGLGVIDSPDASTIEFRKALTSAGVRHSVVGTDCVSANDQDTPFDLSTQMEDTGAACLIASDTTAERVLEFAEAGAEMVVDINPSPHDVSGLDGSGVYRLPVAYTFDGGNKVRSIDNVVDDLKTTVGTQRDVAVLIDPTAVQDPVSMRAIVDTLQHSQEHGLGQIHALKDFRDTVAPTDEKYRLLTTMKRGRMLASGESITQNTSEQDELAKDAATAWKFFDLFTDAKTGLVPGTVWMEGESRSSYPFATMWDIGTQIMALISAHTH